jgi:predicted GIY-YIG superfamily endonuclease
MNKQRILDILNKASKNETAFTGDEVVYFLFNSNNEIVYIGISYCLTERLLKHFKDKDFLYWKVLFFDTLKQTEELERELIALFRPKYNKKIANSYDYDLVLSILKDCRFVSKRSDYIGVFTKNGIEYKMSLRGRYWYKKTLK